MAKLRDKIESELENIDQVLTELPNHADLQNLSTLEVAGVAALLQSFYNGVENVIKQILTSKDVPIPTGPSWHRDVVNLAYEHGMISQQTKGNLGDYLAFRHFVGHAYAFDVYPPRLVPLVQHIGGVYEQLRTDLRSILES